MKKKLLLLTISSLLLIPLAYSAPMWDKDPKGFEHGLAVIINGQEYFFKGPGSIEGEIDVPGHTWKQTGKFRVIGRHYNVGPWAAPPGTPWWATGEPYGVLLYKVDGIIDVPPGELPEGREDWLKDHGYVHIHEFVDEYSDELEEYVVYLKHTAVRSFTLDGGPAQPDPWYKHDVTPGIDPLFPNNW